MKFISSSLIYRIKLLCYLLTPPIFQWISNKVSKNRKKLLEEDPSFLSSLNELESKGIEHFIDPDMVKQFCRAKKLSCSVSDNHYKVDQRLQRNLTELFDDGFTVVKNVLSEANLKDINSKLVPMAEDGISRLRGHRDLHNSRVSSKVIKEVNGNITALYNLYDGVIRFRGIESICPALENIGISTDIHKICESYLGGTVSPSKTYLDVKGIVDATDSSVGLHGDSFTKICKVFIALEDITDDNAPFLYFSRSHKQHKWRLFKDLLEFSDINSEYHDYFSMYNILSMFKVSEEDNGIDIKPLRITLKAGDAIIADTAGIHGATDLISGRRLQIGLVFERRGLGAEDKYAAL